MLDAVSLNLRHRAAVEFGRGRLTSKHREQLLAVDETVTKHRPRQLDGEEPDQAHHWIAAGFSDADVVAWLEVGVPWSTSAQQLRDAGVSPREVGGEYEPDITLGLAFARGEVSLREVFALRRGPREVK